MKTYGLVVVGGGPGGYVSALRAAKLGVHVALVEAAELGGTCLNRGCIPSKTLLHQASLVEMAQKAADWGIEIGDVHPSLPKMMVKKDAIIEQLRKGIQGLLRAGKIDVYQGMGHVTQDLSVTIENGEGQTVIQGEKVILATGSKPFVPDIPGLKSTAYHTSDTIFEITELPSSLIIIGGGVIGVEFACIFAQLGVEVTVMELAEHIIPNEDAQAAAVLHKALTKRGVKILTSAKVEEVREAQGRKQVQVTHANGATEEYSAEMLLAAIGRRPNFSGIEQLNVKKNGPFVAVNDWLETSLPNIYAVGDLIGGWQLAHVASAEGLVAAANAAQPKSEAMDYKAVPRCIYTSPEIASVGLTEEEARKKGYKVKVEKFHNAGNSKSLIEDDTDGFVKIIAEETYGEILGAVMVGKSTTEFVSEVSAFIHLEGTVEEMSTLIHPHPSLSEKLFEAACAYRGLSIHK